MGEGSTVNGEPESMWRREGGRAPRKWRKGCCRTCGGVRQQAAGCRALTWGGAAEGPWAAARAKLRAGAQVKLSPGRPESVNWGVVVAGQGLVLKEDRGACGREEELPAWEGASGSQNGREGRKGLDGIVL